MTTHYGVRYNIFVTGKTMKIVDLFRDKEMKRKIVKQSGDEYTAMVRMSGGLVSLQRLINTRDKVY